MTRIIAVDPGLASTAVVAMTQSEVVATWTFTTPGGGHKVDFANAIERAESIASRIAALGAELGAIDAVVVETYVDIPGALRGVANRWTTPLCIGLLIPALRSIAPGGVIHWQSAETVMRESRTLRDMWAAGARAKRDTLLAGDRMLTNAHTRSAAAHGLFYAKMHEEGTR